ncbi:isopenicillin N synthase family dioxygenase [Thalassolituus sp. LLYu03]|uniref:isopenicillin N synthase family dioxygenase n=1 Tax=Thalassolituus sp. LLYu03 TaxID=3421656 RepID=UPI003D28E104
MAAEASTPLTQPAPVSEENTSRDFQSIPVIDIGGLYSDDLSERQRVARDIAHAAEQVGFLYIRNHHISDERMARLINQTRAFFDRPMAEKMRWYIGHSANHSGYVPEGEEQFYGGKTDRKEAYDVSFDLTDFTQKRPMLGAMQWPDIEGFKDDIKAYYDDALDLGRLLFRAFALALDLDEFTFTRQMNNPPNQLRLIHYPFDAAATDREGIGAHTDYECFTLLLPTADGLEVLNGQGQWINAPVKPGCFVVNIGDMLEILSNGRFKATSHRVRKVREERYSFPLFCTLDYDVVIRPLVSEAAGIAPGHYQPLTCGDHLYAQTIHTFRYLKERLAAGEITLPDSAHAASSFGHLRDALETP